VTVETSLGSIQLELFAADAPITVRNFLDYAESGFYEGTICHRVIADFIVQCGGFTPDLNRKLTRPAIVNEADNGRQNQRGTVAMARMSAVDSATAQFFFNLTDNTSLDHGIRDFGYAVFGRVVAGMDVIDQIGRVETAARRGHRYVPVAPVVIKSVKHSTAP